MCIRDRRACVNMGPLNSGQGSSHRRLTPSFANRSTSNTRYGLITVHEQRHGIRNTSSAIVRLLDPGPNPLSPDVLAKQHSFGVLEVSSFLIPSCTWKHHCRPKDKQCKVVSTTAGPMVGLGDSLAGHPMTLSVDRSKSSRLGRNHGT